MDFRKFQRDQIQDVGFTKELAVLLNNVVIDTTETRNCELAFWLFRVRIKIRANASNTASSLVDSHSLF